MKEALKSSDVNLEEAKCSCGKEIGLKIFKEVDFELYSKITGVVECYLCLDETTGYTCNKCTKTSFCNDCLMMYCKHK